MNDLLIPFALRERDLALVDVADGPAGSACGCICPSCKSPLIARQGRTKVWHFAHAARVDHHDTEAPCDFSWPVSIRLMARQLVGHGLAIALPAAEFPVYTDGLPRRPPEPFVTAALPQSLSTAKAVCDTGLGPVQVDVIVPTPSGPLILYMTNAQRQAPAELSAPITPCAGVVEIKLGAFHRFLRKNQMEQSPKAALRLFLEEDHDSKHWLFHPAADQLRYEERERRMVASLGQRFEGTHVNRARGPISSNRHFSSHSTIPPTHLEAKQPMAAIPGDPLLYVCISCDAKWGVKTGPMRPCPFCGALEMSTRLSPQ